MKQKYFNLALLVLALWNHGMLFFSCVGYFKIWVFIIIVIKTYKCFKEIKFAQTFIYSKSYVSFGFLKEEF